MVSRVAAWPPSSCPAFFALVPRESETDSVRDRGHRHAGGMLKRGDRGMTTESVGALNEIMCKERLAMERWSRRDPSLTNVPAGSPTLQMPYRFGAPPGMPASIEHLSRPSVADSVEHFMRSASLPQLPGGLPSTNARRVPRKPSISDTFRHRLAPATPVDLSLIHI